VFRGVFSWAVVVTTIWGTITPRATPASSAITVLRIIELPRLLSRRTNQPGRGGRPPDLQIEGFLSDVTSPDRLFK
jgi:hypothetical protein